MAAARGRAPSRPGRECEERGGEGEEEGKREKGRWKQKKNENFMLYT